MYTWILSSLQPFAHARWLAKDTSTSMQMYGDHFDKCMFKTGGSSEAVLSWEGSNNVVLHFSCSTTSVVLLVFDTLSSNSGLHTFGLRHPCLLPASGCGWEGVTTQYSSISVHTEVMYSTLIIGRAHHQVWTPWLDQSSCWLLLDWLLVPKTRALYIAQLGAHGTNVMLWTRWLPLHLHQHCQLLAVLWADRWCFPHGMCSMITVETRQRMYWQ